MVLPEKFEKNPHWENPTPNSNHNKETLQSIKWIWRIISIWIFLWFWMFSVICPYYHCLNVRLITKTIKPQRGQFTDQNLLPHSGVSLEDIQ